MPAPHGSQSSAALDLSHVQRKSSSAGADLFTRLTSSGNTTNSSSQSMKESSSGAQPVPGPSRLYSGAPSSSQRDRRGSKVNAKKNSSTTSYSTSSQSTAGSKGKANTSSGPLEANVMSLFGHVQVLDEDIDAEPTAWEAEMDRMLGLGGGRTTKNKGKVKCSAAHSGTTAQKNDATDVMSQNSMANRTASFSTTSHVSVSDADKGGKRKPSLEQRTTSGRLHHDASDARAQNSHKDISSRANSLKKHSMHLQELVVGSHRDNPSVSHNTRTQIGSSCGFKRTAEDPLDDSQKHSHIPVFQHSNSQALSSDALFDSLFDHSDDESSSNPALKRLHILRNGPRAGSKTYKPLRNAPFEVDVAMKKARLELEPLPIKSPSPHVPPAFSSPSPPPPSSRAFLRPHSTTELHAHLVSRNKPEIIDISDDDAPSVVITAEPVHRRNRESHFPKTMHSSNAEECGDLDLCDDNDDDVIDLT
jgi:hypothetical protein